MTERAQIQFRTDDTFAEGIFVELLGPGLYRLEETPALANGGADPIHAGDVVELEALPDGSHRLVRVVTRSPMRHYQWVVPRELVESGELRDFLDAVENEGGSWERVFGGVLYVHLPPESALDADVELTRRVAAAGDTAHDA
ncbi:MAG TPA: hypothetical protein VF041_02875 [Gemmatimonadaceae bacterium]